MKRKGTMLATALAVTVAAPTAHALVTGSQTAARPVTIGFSVATAGGDERAARSAGTFTMTGPMADAGNVTTTYRFAGAQIDGTATLIGARGILTIDLRGTFGPAVGGRRSAGGRWRVLGGTARYRHLAGRGRWEAVADLGAAPSGMMPPTMRGAFVGHVYRRSTVRRVQPQRTPRCCRVPGAKP